jgi:tetratricopeptide (TPR) repeat protein
LAWEEKALEAELDYAHSYRSVGDHHWLVSGQLDDAVVWHKKGIDLDLGNPVYPAVLGMLLLDLGDPGTAKYWINRSIALGPENFWPNLAMQLLQLYQGDEVASFDDERKDFTRSDYRFYIGSIQLLRDHGFRTGRYAEARTLYEENRPELLGEEAPNVEYGNTGVAIDLALVLSKTGERERAGLLLERALERIQTIPRLGKYGYGVADVKIYALQGDRKKALSALRQAIDEGWRGFWWYLLKHDPSLESLHNEPEFQAMVAEIEADMAAQLARVREMERNGELEPIPEISATTH